MMKNLILLALILTSLFSGCIKFYSDATVTYESHPTKITYIIRYGYEIECTGIGKYKINYRCDIPETLNGNVDYNVIHEQDYEIITLAENSLVNWNISGEDTRRFSLGLTATVEAESFLISDLNGKDALSTIEINNLYPEVVEKYCHGQSNEGILLINPDDPAIKAIAYNVADETKVDNSFILAKSLFIWLKENIVYQTHDEEDRTTQPSALTLEKGAGDCDDLSFLYISLCRALDIPARFIRGYLLNEEGGKVTASPHAWVEVFVGGAIGNQGWIPVECACSTSLIKTDVNQNFGVEDAFHLRLFIDNGSNESINVSSADIYVEYTPNRRVRVQSFLEIEEYFELESKKLVVTNDNIRYYQ
jgi:hypothetical protein